MPSSSVVAFIIHLYLHFSSSGYLRVICTMSHIPSILSNTENVKYLNGFKYSYLILISTRFQGNIFKLNNSHIFKFMWFLVTDTNL